MPSARPATIGTVAKRRFYRLDHGVRHIPGVDIYKPVIQGFRRRRRTGVQAIAGNNARAQVYHFQAMGFMVGPTDAFSKGFGQGVGKIPLCEGAADFRAARDILSARAARGANR